MHRLATILFAMAMTGAIAPTASAQSEGGGKYPGTLQIVGALHCRATLEDATPRLETMILNCQYRQSNHSQEPVWLRGEMIGSGLWQADPGVVRLMWNVLAPTPAVRPTDIAGDYDIEPSYEYRLADERSGILYGGLGDTFALELVSASLQVEPSTRLTLRTSDATAAPRAPG